MSMAVNGGSAAGTAGSFNHVSGVQGKDKSIQKWKKVGESKKSRIKKPLNYNPREISNQLVRASKSRVAAVVLVRAKVKLGSLRQAYASGQYDMGEVRTALAHARRMVECSRLKVRNLKEEETIKSRNDNGESLGKQKKKSEVRRRVKKKEQEIKAKIAVEESHRVLKEKQMQQELRQKRQKHRSEELGKISEADMKYIEDKMKENQNSSSIQESGAVLEISAASAQLAEIKMMEQQIEQQVENQVEMELGSLDMGGADVSMQGAVSGGCETQGAETAAVTVDVTI